MASQAHLSEGPAAPAPWFFTGRHGRLLYGQRWEPWPQLQGTAPAPVVLVHGFAEHIGRYENLGRALAASGRTLWAMDFAGFGRSDGPRGIPGPVDDVLADMDRLIAAAGTAAGQRAGHGVGPKPVLLGHSMGGAFAAAYALDHADQLSGLVLSAPAVHLAGRPKWQVVPAEGLAAVAPRIGLGRIDPARLSRDPEVGAQFAADPLVWHGTVPARTAVEMYRAGRLVMKRAGELTLPLLVLHGEADAIVPVDSSRRLYAAVGSRDKQLRVFKGLLHEVFQEVGKQEAIAVLLEWLGRHRR
jgi:acylglycerol lipase